MQIRNIFFCGLLCLMMLVPGDGMNDVALATTGNAGVYQKVTEMLENEPLLEGAVAGISVRSADTGELLYEYNGDIRLRPASNMKLLTAAVALSKLGPDYQFSTEVWADGEINGKTLYGNLYLRGKGDPTLLPEDLQTIAKDLKKSGIDTIAGNVVADESWYDDIRHSPDLIWSDEHTYYGAQVSALTVSPDKEFDAGTAVLTIAPGERIGDPAKITVFPYVRGYVTIVNKATTVSPDSSGEMKTTRKHGENTIIIEGTIPLQAKPEKEWISIWEPGKWTAHLFKKALQDEGVVVRGPVRTGVVPAGAKRLAVRKSMPLSELLKPFMMLSNNGHADILTKELGKTFCGEGSFEKGLQVLEEELKRYGLMPGEYLIRDGSGISHLTLLTANQVSNLLYLVQKEPWFPVFFASLPEAGNTERLGGGTMRHRFNGTPLAGQIRAKTGTLTTVTSISGYMATKTGKKLIFSILFNNLLNEEAGKNLEDEIIAILWEQ